MLNAGRSSAASAFSLHGASLTLELDAATPEPLQAIVSSWVRKCADAVAIYYGRFPVPEAYLHVPVVAGAGVRGGQTFPGKVPLIRVRVGEATAEAQLMQDDWVMVHEMIHLAFPWLGLRHNWMAEGLAVYVESIARVQAGHLQPERIWQDFIVSMPKGLPREGEGGLDQTRSWGRTYWGGALFCLLCDIRIREKTGNRRGLQHALRAINAERDFRQEWPFRETLAIGDSGTGTSVLVDSYDEMKDTPVTTDLDQLWISLGIDRMAAGLRFDDSAPLAAIRRSITTPLSD
jgi:hypothetical protein